MIPAIAIEIAVGGRIEFGAIGLERMRRELLDIDLGGCRKALLSCSAVPQAAANLPGWHC
jgi:hypothetical protein